MKHLLIVGITLSWLAVTQANAQVWPGKQWAVATPESQGLSTSSLDAAAECAMKHGGGSGCVIRHGHLVKEWGSVTACFWLDVEVPATAAPGEYRTRIEVSSDGTSVELPLVLKVHRAKVPVEGKLLLTKQEQIVGDDEAARMLSRPIRGPWTL